MKTTANEYPYIRAWGRMLHSFSYYISDEVERARRDNAPANAIYRDSDGRWHTVADITAPDTLEVLERMVQRD